MKRAIIDLGTHSALLLIIDESTPSPPLPFTVLGDEARICRLGEGLHRSRQLSLAACERTLAVLREFKAHCAAHAVAEMVVVGTEACRRADNSGDLGRMIAQDLGLQLEIISPDAEARLSFRAATFDFGREPRPPVVIDLGGGSTEFIYQQHEDLVSVSIPMGSVVLTEKFLTTDPPTPSEKQALSQEIRTTLKRQLAVFPYRGPMIALAGTATTLAAIDLGLGSYDPIGVQGHSLKADHLARMIGQLFSLPLEKRKKIQGLHPDRAEVILGGAVLLEEILRFFGEDHCRVSDRGLRYGLALQLTQCVKK